MAGEPGKADWQEVKLDEVLLQQVEIHCSGENIHAALNLMAGYITSIREIQNGNGNFRPIAVEAERELRAFLVELRIARFSGVSYRPA